MGVIVRNGNIYGGLEKDFTVVNSLDTIENPIKNHLYAVDDRLYYYNGTNWTEISAESGVVRPINSNTNNILIGDGYNWAKSSVFYTKSFTLPANYSWVQYRDKVISIIEGEGDMICLSKKSATENLNSPILGISGQAKAFIEENADIDISGNTQFYMHENPKVYIEGDAILKLDGKFCFAADGKSYIKMDDCAGINMTNLACINMQGSESGFVEKDQVIGGPSPYFGMSSSATFIMNGGQTAPLLVANPDSFIFVGEHGNGSKFNGEDWTQWRPSLEPDDISIEPIFDPDSRSSEPYFKIGPGTHFIAETTDGSSYINIGNKKGRNQIIVDTNEFGTFNLRAGADKGGIINCLIGGTNLFLQMSDSIHHEEQNDSIFIMKTTIPNESSKRRILGKTFTFETSNSYSNSTYENLSAADKVKFLAGVAFENSEVDNIGSAPQYLDSGTFSSEPAEGGTYLTTVSGYYYADSHLGKDWNTIIDHNTYGTQSPIVQLYGQCNFLMKGRQFMGRTAQKVSGFPLLEVADDAEIRFIGGSKINMNNNAKITMDNIGEISIIEGAKISMSGTGNITVDSTGITINGVNFTNEQLEALKQMIS